MGRIQTFTRISFTKAAKDLVAGLIAFPAAANDDQVDALTQALRRLYPLFNKLKISQAALDEAMGR